MRRYDCKHHGHPHLKRPVSRKKLRQELSQLCRRAGIKGTLEWPESLGRTHERNWRRYAQVATHTRPPAFELAPQTRWLDAAHRRGLLAHEVGHVLDPYGSEDDADQAAFESLGIRIGYDHRWPGKGLQVATNPDESVRELERVVSVDPGNAEAHAALASARLRTGERRKGTQALLRALRLSLPEALSGDPESFTKYVRIWWKRKHPAEVIVDEFDPGEVVAAGMLGLRTKKARKELLDSIVYGIWEDRRDRRVRPQGHTDNGGRWYPSEAEDAGGDITARVRSPSRRWPFSYLNRARTRQHVRVLVDRALAGHESPPDVDARMLIYANRFLRKAWPRKRLLYRNPQSKAKTVAELIVYSDTPERDDLARWVAHRWVELGWVTWDEINRALEQEIERLERESYKGNPPRGSRKVRNKTYYWSSERPARIGMKIPVFRGVRGAMPLEELWEEVRRAEYPDVVPRLGSVMLCSEEAGFCAPGGGNYVYKVRATGRVSVVNAEAWSDTVMEYLDAAGMGSRRDVPISELRATARDSLVSRARGYWSGEDFSAPWGAALPEVLLRGEAVIVEQVHGPRA
jgi:hypothetical protein